MGAHMHIICVPKLKICIRCLDMMFDTHTHPHPHPHTHIYTHTHIIKVVSRKIDDNEQNL